MEPPQANYEGCWHEHAPSNYIRATVGTTTAHLQQTPAQKVEKIRALLAKGSVRARTMKSLLLARVDSAVAMQPFFRNPSDEHCAFCGGHHNFRYCPEAKAKCNAIRAAGLCPEKWVSMMAGNAVARDVTALGLDLLKFAQAADLSMSTKARSVLENQGSKGSVRANPAQTSAPERYQGEAAYKRANYGTNGPR